MNSEDGCKDYANYTGRKIFLLVDTTDLGLICADEEFKYECTGDCCRARSSKPEFKDICLNKTSTERIPVSSTPNTKKKDGEIQKNQVPITKGIE